MIKDCLSQTWMSYFGQSMSGHRITNCRLWRSKEASVEFQLLLLTKIIVLVDLLHSIPLVVARARRVPPLHGRLLVIGPAQARAPPLPALAQEERVGQARGRHQGPAAGREGQVGGRVGTAHRAVARGSEPEGAGWEGRVPRGRAGGGEARERVRAANGEHPGYGVPRGG